MPKRRGLRRLRGPSPSLLAQFDFAPDTSFEDAAEATVAVAQSEFGAPAAAVVQAAFEARGIL